MVDVLTGEAVRRLSLVSRGETTVAQAFVANWGVTAEQVGRGAQAFAKAMNAWQNEMARAGKRQPENETEGGHHGRHQRTQGRTD